MTHHVSKQNPEANPLDRSHVLLKPRSCETYKVNTVLSSNPFAMSRSIIYMRNVLQCGFCNNAESFKHTGELSRRLRDEENMLCAGEKDAGALKTTGSQLLYVWHADLAQERN